MMLYLKEFLISILTVSGLLLIWYKLELKQHKPLNALILPILFITIIDAYGSLYFFKNSMFVTQSFLILLVTLYYKRPLRKVVTEFCVTLVLLYIVLIPFIILLGLLINIDYYYFKVILSGYQLIVSFIIFQYVPIDSFYRMYSDLLEKSIYLILSIVLVSYIFIIASSEPLDTLILLSVLFLAFTFTMIAFINSILEGREQANMVNAYEQHSHTIVPLLDEIRSKQHDFKNHIAAIYGLCEQSAVDTAPIKDYIQSLNQSLQGSDVMLSMKNKVIGAIISSKAYEAEMNHIDFICDVPPYEVNFQMQDYEYASLISNLLDNAIEAPCKSTADRKKVFFKIGTTGSTNYIEVGNNGLPIGQHEISKIFRKGYTTKDTKKGHGYGLYTVKKILSKYNGTIEVALQDGFTVFRAIMPIKM